MRIWEYPPVRTGNADTDTRNLWDFLTRLIQYLEQKERETENGGGTVTVAGSTTRQASGGRVTVDAAIDPDSENPVQNAAIAAALDEKANTADLGAVATSNDYNDLDNLPTIPGGAYVVDSAMSDSSENPVQNKIVKAYIDSQGGGGGGGSTELIVRSLGVQSFTVAAGADLIDSSTVVTYAGYTPLGVVGLALGDTALTAYGFQIANNLFYLAVHNPTNASITTNNGIVKVLYQKV